MSYIDDARQALDTELHDRGLRCDQQLLDLYTLLVLIGGELTDLEDVHAAWSAWAARHMREHPDLVEFDDLPPGTQQAEAPYRDAIRAAADRIAPDDPGDETRIQVYLRFEHPEVQLGPERRLRPDLVLGRGPQGRHLDFGAAIPRLLRETADELEARHEPADTASAES